MKTFFLIILSSFLFANVSLADDTSCAMEAEAAAVAAAKQKYNPNNSDTGTSVSNEGTVSEAQGLDEYLKFYTVRVTDEVGVSYWSVVASTRTCDIQQTTLVLED